jgi:Domain of unknown function (DUF4136)
MKYLVSLFLPIWILFSCSSSITVISDFDKTIDFSEYQNLEYYGWKENSDRILNRFNKERFEKAFGNEFKKRGVKVVEKGEGDMIVTLYVVTEKKTETIANTTYSGGMGGYYGYGPGYGWGGGHSNTTYNTYEYTVGTLMVSVYDAKKKKLIWEAIGKGVVKEKSKDPEAEINKTVSKIMFDYPIKPISD